MNTPVPCRICQTPAPEFARAPVMGRHEAVYHRCPACGFVFVPSPFWLAESYVDAINRTDIGIVDRCETTACATKTVLELCLRDCRDCLDYGSGYGLFVRRMRDLGYHFHGFDRYGTDLFAREFHVRDTNGRHFDLITAFEVMEHLQNPLEELSGIFAMGGSFLFSTELLPDPAPQPEDWWYYGLDHGQHIGFFTYRALRIVADRFSRKLLTNGHNLHLITSRPVSGRWFRWVSQGRFPRLFTAIHKKTSLLTSDFEAIRQSALAASLASGGKPNPKPNPPE